MAVSTNQRKYKKNSPPEEKKTKKNQPISMKSVSNQAKLGHPPLPDRRPSIEVDLRDSPPEPADRPQRSEVAKLTRRPCHCLWRSTIHRRLHLQRLKAQMQPLSSHIHPTMSPVNLPTHSPHLSSQRSYPLYPSSQLILLGHPRHCCFQLLTPLQGK